MQIFVDLVVVIVLIFCKYRYALLVKPQLQDPNKIQQRELYYETNKEESRSWANA